MAFASGKHALALCDRCGFSYSYSDIRAEWTGLRVCPECFEFKHPQEDPPVIRVDAEALRDARPARTEPLVIHVGRRVPTVPFEDTPMHAAGHVGSVTVSTP